MSRSSSGCSVRRAWAPALICASRAEVSGGHRAAGVEVQLGVLGQEGVGAGFDLCVEGHRVGVLQEPGDGDEAPVETCVGQRDVEVGLGGAVEPFAFGVLGVGHGGGLDLCLDLDP
ncbi:hypothetical protein ASC77_15220 [Nocardioides sp. Root1257]|nr:hypothetical protein ASC77_15220 [Nocardioides sp. Root1257]